VWWDGKEIREIAVGGDVDLASTPREEKKERTGHR